METYAGSDLVRFEYKDNVILGQESLRAAEAATCADEQDAFWQYHDTLFLNQAGAFADENLRTFAAAIGLNEGDFNSCLGSNRYRNEINAAKIEATDQGIESTPTVRINGQFVASNGVPSFEQLQAIITQELNAVQ